MAEKIEIHFTLTTDEPDSISFEDTYEGLDDPWYRIDVDKFGGVTLWANEEGFEHLGRYFLKLARGKKEIGFHSHHSMEFGEDSHSPPEFTVTLCHAPDIQ